MKISLRPLEWKEWKSYLRWINTREIARLVDRYLPVSQFQHKKFYESIIEDKTKVYFSIYENDKKFVGVVALNKVDLKNRKAEFYICLEPKKSRGKGIGVAATRALLAYGFEELNLNRIYLYTPSFNKPAVTCYKKAGFSEEGRAKQDLCIDGKYFDTLRMACLRKDFSKLVKRGRG